MQNNLNHTLSLKVKYSSQYIFVGLIQLAISDILVWFKMEYVKPTPKLYL